MGFERRRLGTAGGSHVELCGPLCRRIEVPPLSTSEKHSLCALKGLAFESPRVALATGLWRHPSHGLWGPLPWALEDPVQWKAFSRGHAQAFSDALDSEAWS